MWQSGQCLYRMLCKCLYIYCVLCIYVFLSVLSLLGNIKNLNNVTGRALEHSSVLSTKRKNAEALNACFKVGSQTECSGNSWSSKKLLLPHIYKANGKRRLVSLGGDHDSFGRRLDSPVMAYLRLNVDYLYTFFKCIFVIFCYPFTWFYCWSSFKFVIMCRIRQRNNYL